MYSKRRKLAGTAVSPSKGRVLPWPPQPSAFRSRRPSKWERGTASTHRLPCPSHSCLFDDLWYLIWILKPVKSYFRNLVNNLGLYLVLRIQLKLTHRRKKMTFVHTHQLIIISNYIHTLILLSRLPQFICLRIPSTIIKIETNQRLKNE